MRYSFNVRGNTKSEALDAAFDKVEEVIATQIIHTRDKDAIRANLSAAVGLLSDTVPDGHVVGVSCNGYVSWSDIPLKGDGSNVAEIPLRSVSISASAQYFMPLTT